MEHIKVYIRKVAFVTPFNELSLLLPHPYRQATWVRQDSGLRQMLSDQF